MVENNFTYMFTNPEMDEPKDSMGQDLVLWPVNGGYTMEGKKLLLNTGLAKCVSARSNSVI